MSWSIPISSPSKASHPPKLGQDRFGHMSDDQLNSELINIGLPISGSRIEKENRLRKLYTKSAKVKNKKGKQHDKTLNKIEEIKKRREERRAKMEEKVLIS